MAHSSLKPHNLLYINDPGSWHPLSDITHILRTFCFVLIVQLSDMAYHTY